MLAIDATYTRQFTSEHWNKAPKYGSDQTIDTCILAMDIYDEYDMRWSSAKGIWPQSSPSISSTHLSLCPARSVSIWFLTINFLLSPASNPLFWSIQISIEKKRARISYNPAHFELIYTYRSNEWFWSTWWPSKSDVSGGWWWWWSWSCGLLLSMRWEENDADCDL